MTTLVVDSSVVLAWFREEDQSTEARAVAREELLAPPLLHLEVLNVAGRKWGWPEEALLELLSLLERSSISVDEPPANAVAHWVGRGLTAYDASYVALAEVHDCPLVTADAGILALAPGQARPLGGRVD